MEERMNKEKLRTAYNKKWFIEIRRLWIFILFAVLMLAWDTNRSVVLFATAITTGTMAIAHLTRKLLFKYIDMRDLAYEALKNPVGASIVFAAMIYLLTVLIQSTVVLLK
jgi:hypothetical protein